MELLDMIQQAIESTAADVLFGLIVLVSVGLVVLMFFFAGLALHGFWRWLTRGSWGKVIVSAERKALK